MTPRSKELEAGAILSVTHERLTTASELLGRDRDADQVRGMLHAAGLTLDTARGLIDARTASPHGRARP